MNIHERLTKVLFLVNYTRKEAKKDRVYWQQWNKCVKSFPRQKPGNVPL